MTLVGAADNRFTFSTSVFAFPQGRFSFRLKFLAETDDD